MDGADFSDESDRLEEVLEDSEGNGEIRKVKLRWKVKNEL